MAMISPAYTLYLLTTPNLLQKASFSETWKKPSRGYTQSHVAPISCCILSLVVSVYYMLKYFRLSQKWFQKNSPAYIGPIDFLGPIFIFIII